MRSTISNKPKHAQSCGAGGALHGHEAWIRRCRPHGRPYDLASARRRLRAHRLRHQRGGDQANSRTRCNRGGLTGRGRLRRRNRADVPADAGHRAHGGHRRGRRHARLEGAHPHRSVDHRADDCRHRRARDRQAQDHAGRCAGQRRRGRCQGRHAGGDGVLSEGDLSGGRADPQDLRQAVLHGREAGPRADRQARQQPAGRRGDGGVVGGAGDGRQGRHRSAGDDRHHQCRQRPQQRHAGQVPALDPARHLRFRLRHRALLQGRAAVRRRGRGARRADGGRRGRAADAGRDERQVRAAVRLHAHRQGGRGMGGRRDPLAAQGQQQGRLRTAHDGRGLGIGARRAAGAPAGPLGAGRDAGGPARRCDRQGQGLPARFPGLRVRGAQSAVEPAGGRHGPGDGWWCQHHCRWRDGQPGRRRVRQRHPRARPGARGHACRQHLPPRRGDLAGVAGAGAAHAFIGSGAAGGGSGRLRGRRANRPGPDDADLARLYRPTGTGQSAGGGAGRGRAAAAG